MGAAVLPVVPFAAALVTLIWQLALQTSSGHLDGHGWAPLHHAALLLPAEFWIAAQLHSEMVQYTAT